MNSMTRLKRAIDTYKLKSEHPAKTCVRCNNSSVFYGIFWHGKCICGACLDHIGK